MNTDDPRITAYALDALAPSERLEVEVALAQNAELRNAVAEVEEVSAALSEAFRMRPEVGLSSAQREAIRDAARKQLVVPEPVMGEDSSQQERTSESGIVDFPAHARHARFPAPLLAAGMGAIAAGLAVMVAVNLSEDGANPENLTGGLTRAVVAGEEELATMRVQIIGSKASNEEVRVLTAIGVNGASGTNRTHPLPKLVPPEGGSLLVEVKIPQSKSPQGTNHEVRPYAEPAKVASHDFLDPARDPLSNLPRQNGLSGQELANSYASVRQALNLGAPLPKSIRVSDMMGHFDFSMPTVTAESSMAEGEVSYAAAEVADCPWQPDHLLARVLLRSPGGEFTAEDLQVEFNPSVVESYRLLGFSEAEKGANVMALYQIVPHAGLDDQPEPSLADRGDGEIELRYGKLAAHPTAVFPEGDSRNRELLVVTTPGEYGAQLPLELQRTPMTSAGEDFRFAAAVISFSMLLDDSAVSESSVSSMGEFGLNYDEVIALAQSALGSDEDGERKRFVELVKAARDRAAR